MTEATALAETIVATLTGTGAADLDLFDLDLSSVTTMTEDERAEFASALVDKTMGLAGEAFVLRSQALAKHKEAVALLRQADHVEFLRQLRDAQAKVHAQLTTAEDHAATLAAEVERLTVLEVEALDRLTDAEENHTGLAAQHQQYVNLAAKASRLTDSLAQVTAARAILADRQRDATGASTARASAEAMQGEQRQVLDEIRAAHTLATAIIETAEQRPETAPRGIETLLFALTDAATGFDALTPEEQTQVRGILASFSQTTGADRPARNESREAGYQAGLREGRDENRRWNPMPTGSQTVHAPGVTPGAGRR